MQRFPSPSVISFCFLTVLSHFSFHMAMAQTDSDLPLQFQPEFQDLYARRFLVTTPNATVLYMNLDKGPADFLSDGAAFTKTGAAVDYYIVNRVPADGWDQPTFPNYYVFPNASAKSCGSLMTGQFELSLFGENARAGLRIEVGPQAAVPQCSGRPQQLWSGLAYSTRAFNRAPLYSYLYSLAPPFEGWPSLELPTSSMDLIFNYLWWFGDFMEEFTVLGTYNLNFIGNRYDSRATTLPTTLNYDAAFIAPNSDSYMSMNQAIIGIGGSMTAVCQHGDLFSYDATYVEAGESLSLGAPILCDTFTSVDDLHFACDNRSDCVGFTTREASGLEKADCMLISNSVSPSSSNVAAWPRMLYQKPVAASPICAVTSNWLSSRVHIYIEQSSFATGSVQIRRNGYIVAECGGSKPFVNGVMGKDGECGTYYLCFSTTVPSTSYITVTGTNLKPSTCQNSLSVIFETAQDGPQYPSYDVSDMSSMPITSSSVEPLSARAFVYKASQVSLKVLQSGFDCGLYSIQNGGAECPETLIRLTTPNSCQTCGGAKGFYEGFQGDDGYCDAASLGYYQFCGPRLSVTDTLLPSTGTCESNGELPPVTGSSYTGIVSVAATALSTCVASSFLSFAGLLYASPDPSVISFIPVFPLKDGPNVRTLFAGPLNATREEMMIRLATPDGAFYDFFVAPLFQFGPTSNPQMAYYVDWFHLYSLPQLSLSPNNTQVCVLDTQSTDSIYCMAYMPIGTTRVRVTVAQADFQAQQITVDIMPDAVITSSRTCGGSYRFNDGYGQQDKCDTYLECLDEYVYDSGFDAVTSSLSFVRIGFPKGLAARSCDFPGVAIVTFSQEPPTNFTGCAADEFMCMKERKCIPIASVCNGIQDCSNNNDEATCTSWSDIGNQNFCFPSIPTALVVVSNTSSFVDCRRLAVINPVRVYGFVIDNSGVCSLYAPAMIESIFYDEIALEHASCDRPGSNTFLNIPAPDVFSLCHSSIQCSGNGQSITTKINGVRNVPQMCYCVCNPGNFGDDCSFKLDLYQKTSLLARLPVGSALDALEYSSSPYTSVLTNGWSQMSAKCGFDGFYAVSATEVDMVCEFTSAREIASDVVNFYESLLQPGAIQQVNTLLTQAYVQVPILSLALTTSMAPMVAMPDCTQLSSTSYACGFSSSFDSFRIVVTSNKPTLSATAIYSEDGTAHSAIPVDCVLIPSIYRSICFVSSCQVNISGSRSASVNVSDVVRSIDPMYAGSCDEKFYLQARVSYGNVPLDTTDATNNKPKDYSPYLIGGVVLFIAGALIAWLIAIFFGARHISRKRRAMEQVDFTPMTEVERIKAIMLVDLAFEREIEETKSLRNDRWAVGFGVFGLMCGVGASFLVVYHATGRGRESNFQVLYEEYSNSQCSAAFSSYMPTRVFAVPTGSNECDKMEVMGEAAGVAYATGECNGADGFYTVTYQGGSSKESCKESEPIVLSSGSCVPIQEIDPKSSRNVYVQLRCSTTSQVSQRIDAIDSYVNGPDVFQDKQADALFPQTNLAANQPSSLGFVADYTIKTSSSNYPDTLDSQATPSDFDGNYDSQRIVMQTSGCSYLTGDAETCLSSEETSLLAQMNDLSGTAAITLGPTTNDVPIGYVLNGFGTSSQNTWTAAGSQAHRYFGAAGTAFDMGANFPTDRENPDDSEGYTISMYLRADSSTQGFAYAVCDAFEDSTTRVNHLLDRLGGMIAGGRGGRLWFNHTYKVYQSLYVDGPGKSLTFGYASPTLTDRLHLLEYDLSAIGMERVLNGLWHHVAIAFLVENGRVRAQLTVDGESSYTKAGWSVCVSEFPEPITRSFGASAPVFDRVVDIVTNGGMVVTGYFNGGIYALRAEAKPLLNTDFLQTGTQAMRDNNPFPRSKTLILGCILLILSSFCIMFLLLTALTSLRTMFTSTSAIHSRGVAEEYYELLKEIVDASKLEQGKAGDTFIDFSVPSSLALTEVVLPMRFATALRWTNLNVRQFESVLFELKVQTPADLRPEALLLLLMRCKDPSLTKDSFTVANWNDSVRSEAQYTRKGCLPVFDYLWDNITDAEQEVDLCGCDTFAMAFPELGDSAAEGSANVEMKDITSKIALGQKSVVASAKVRGQDGNVFTSSNALPNVHTPSLSQTFGSIVMPMLGVFQVLYVWATSFEFPAIYSEFFRGLFSFVSVDFAMAFADLSTLVTPLLQLFVGLLAVAFVVFYMFEDNKHFDRVLSQYVWRRDELETTEGKAMEQLSRLPPHLTAALADTLTPEPLIAIEALPVSSSRRVDIFIGKIVGDENLEKNRSEVQVETSHGQELTVGKGDDGKLLIHNGEESKKFEAVGVCCQRHPTTRLSPQTQTQIWPFANPPTCCLVVNGQLCGEQCGVVYSCGLEYEDKETGEQRVCTYGLCEKHCRLNLRLSLAALLVGLKRRLQNNGIRWFFCVLIVLVSNLAYTPVMKTALMILGCHPFYQCEFEHCWDGIDQKFALAVFCCLSIVILFGIGFPLSLFLLLLSRKRSMDVTFVAPEYEGRYASKEGGLFGAAGSYISEREWSRFVSTDATALAQQYQQVFYRWMFFPSITILFRVIALFPAIYLEPRSFEQRLGCAIVQLFVTAFMFGTTTQLSPLILVVVRAGETHQLVILGLQNLSLVLLNDNNTDIGVSLVVVTFVYIAFCILVFVLNVLFPIADSFVQKQRRTKLMARFGLDNTATVTLYFNPFADPVVEANGKSGISVSGGGYSKVEGQASGMHQSTRNIAEEAQRARERTRRGTSFVGESLPGASAVPVRNISLSVSRKKGSIMFAANSRANSGWSPTPSDGEGEGNNNNYNTDGTNDKHMTRVHRFASSQSQVVVQKEGTKGVFADRLATQTEQQCDGPADRVEPQLNPLAQPSVNRNRRTSTVPSYWQRARENSMNKEGVDVEAEELE